MDTPWGPLASLDPDDRSLAFEILQSDKHQLLEGLVVENTFDQILYPLSVATSQRFISLDVDTVIATTGNPGDRWQVFVWAHHPDTATGLRRYLHALGSVADVFLVTHAEQTFFAQQRAHGQPPSTPEPLHDLLRRRTGANPSISDVDLTVRNRDRQMTAFWGYLNTTYPGQRLWSEVVLTRLLINHGIQPFFPAVWNLDRICLFDDQLWMLEVKHKFPFVSQRSQKLAFGLNDGELAMMKLLDEAGIRTLHALIVKPKWSKDVGSMYLHSDLNMRERAAVITLVMDHQRINHLAATQSGSSPSHTALTGRGALKFKTIPASSFAFIGAFSDGTQTLSARFESAFDGLNLPQVTDDLLRNYEVLA